MDTNNQNSNSENASSVNNNNNNNNETQKKKQPTGIFRWNAIVPFSIFVALIILYFTFFFDSNMKSAIEWIGYKVVGAEVNLDSFHSSFLKGRVELNRLQMTSAKTPEFNTLEIGDIKFDINGDALLRLKFVIEEMSVENIQFMSKRAYPGKVAPPPPPPPPGQVSLLTQLQGKALNKVEGETKNNILGDLTAILKGGDYKDQLNSIEDQLESKKLAKDLEEKWKNKQTEWDQKIKSLPKESELKALKKDFESIKYKDFKNPQELEQSIKKFNDAKSQFETKIKIIDQTQKDLKTDLEQLKSDSAALDKSIKNDIESIKTRLKIPKINAAQIAKSIFMDYLNPYLAQLDRINALADKYLPAKYAKMVNQNLSKDALLNPKKKSNEPQENEDDLIQPHAREKGVVYEFPHTKGYPLFWIQKIKISSKSNAQANYGDIEGQITNIVSNQKQINKPTELHISGNLSAQKISGLKIDAELNNLGTTPKAMFDFKVRQYPLENMKLINSPEGQLDIPLANMAMAFSASTEGFKKYLINFENDFNQVKFNIKAQDKIVNELLQNTFSQINQFNLTAKAQGEIKDLDLDVQSSLGDKLEEALKASVQQKLDEVNQQIKTKIDAEVGKIKAQIDQQIQKLTQGAVKDSENVKGQLDSQKTEVDNRINVAKKDLENKAKKSLETEGKKKLDELKKKLKF